jgi:hypothetical protein
LELAEIKGEEMTISRISRNVCLVLSVIWIAVNVFQYSGSLEASAAVVWGCLFLWLLHDVKEKGAIPDSYDFDLFAIKDGDQIIVKRKALK